MQAVTSYKAPELDALAARYAADIPGFVSFSQTVTAKDHFAAMAAAQAVTAPLLTAEIEEFTKAVEARQIVQWQHPYASGCQGDNRNQGRDLQGEGASKEEAVECQCTSPVVSPLLVAQGCAPSTHQDQGKSGACLLV
jgi:hypothetical protein